jgi:hypothetical protein
VESAFNKISAIKFANSPYNSYRNDIEPQLYFSQTPILKAGFHQNGVFTKIASHLSHQSDPIIAAHQILNEDLPYIISILKQMRETCQQYGRGGKPLAFFWSGAGSIQAFEIKHPRGQFDLPEQLLDSL